MNSFFKSFLEVSVFWKTAKSQSMQSRSVNLELSILTQTTATISRFYFVASSGLLQLDVVQNGGYLKERCRLCVASGAIELQFNLLLPAPVTPCSSHQKSSLTLNHPRVTGQVFNPPPSTSPGATCLCPPHQYLSHEFLLFMATAKRGLDSCLVRQQEFLSRTPFSQGKVSFYYLRRASLNFVVYVGGRWFGCYDTRGKLYENMTNSEEPSSLSCVIQQLLITWMSFVGPYASDVLSFLTFM